MTPPLPGRRSSLRRRRNVRVSAALGKRRCVHPARLARIPARREPAGQTAQRRAVARFGPQCSIREIHDEKLDDREPGRCAGPWRCPGADHSGAGEQRPWPHDDPWRRNPRHSQSGNAAPGANTGSPGSNTTTGSSNPAVNPGGNAPSGVNASARPPSSRCRSSKTARTASRRPGPHAARRRGAEQRDRPAEGRSGHLARPRHAQRPAGHRRLRLQGQYRRPVTPLCRTPHLQGRRRARLFLQEHVT